MLRHRFGWKRLSLAGALAYEPDGSDAHLIFELRPGAYNDELLIAFLTLVYDYEQRRVLLIGDGFALAPQSAHGRPDRQPAALVDGGAIARLRPRPESDRTGLAQLEVEGPCQLPPPPDVTSSVFRSAMHALDPPFASGRPAGLRLHGKSVRASAASRCAAVRALYAFCDGVRVVSIP